MARAVRVTLFEREVREKLAASGPAIEILFQRADVLLAEGAAPARNLQPRATPSSARPC